MRAVGTAWYVAPRLLALLSAPVQLGVASLVSWNSRRWVEDPCCWSGSFLCLDACGLASLFVVLTAGNFS